MVVGTYVTSLQVMVVTRVDIVGFFLLLYWGVWYCLAW